MPERDLFFPLTEVPGLRATSEQLSMIYTRYHLAASRAKGGKVLEVACGAGLGLDYVGKGTEMMIGGDLSSQLLEIAHANTNNGTPLVRLDAQHLPFRNATFDMIFMYEALYYIEHPERFLNEAHRTLKPEGTLILCTANKEVQGFVNSPNSFRYFTAAELRNALEEHGFSPDIFGGFLIDSNQAKSKLMLSVRNLASKFHLVPGSLKGREFLKRLAYGKLQEIKPSVRDGMASLHDLVLINSQESSSRFKVIYAVAKVR